MKERIRIGMIGVGGMAQGHIAQLIESKHADIVAIADPSEESIAKTLERNPDLVEEVEQYVDYRNMLATAKPDAVVICSRHCDHFQQIVDSLDSGAHVLVEKPLVNRTVDAHVVIEKARQSGKIVGIGYQRHTIPHFRYIRNAIASGEYGRVQAVSALQQQDWKTATIGTWRQIPEISGGGQINDSGSHLIDILLWTTGLTADRVAATMDNRGAPVDINSALSIRFSEGAVGSVTIVGDAKGWYEDITIWCDHGTFYVRQNLDFTVQLPDGRLHTPSAEEMSPGTGVIANFIAAILGEEEIAAPPECGLRTIELTEAAWRSAANGGAPTLVERSR